MVSHYKCESNRFTIVCKTFWAEHKKSQCYSIYCLEQPFYSNRNCIYHAIRESYGFSLQYRIAHDICQTHRNTYDNLWRYPYRFTYQLFLTDDYTLDNSGRKYYTHYKCYEDDIIM